jgi:hypothetical protein
MDIAVNLVESYLRLTGYLTLSELEIHARNEDGTFRTVTDVDIVALRFPGDTFIAEDDLGTQHQLLLAVDDALMVEDDVIDLIIGEVKQGDAVFNPGLRSHPTLHSVLRRVEWLYADGIDQPIQDLIDHCVSVAPTRGGGAIRARLVAFGQAPENDLHTINLSHVLTTMTGFMERYDHVLRPHNFKDPAPALLQLLQKVGLRVGKS